MSAPTVRWSYSFEANGVRTKSIWRVDSEVKALEAMRLSATTPGRSKFRVVKWTTKARPKVVAKTVATYSSSGNCICCDQADGSAEAGKIYRALRAAEGKRIRHTLEELADE